MDILSEFRVFGIPTSENIISLCKRAVHIFMVQSRCFQFQAMGKEMDFFKTLTPNMFEEVYRCTIPTAESLIASFETVENTSQEQNIVVYLHRYIRSCTKAELVRFVRFTTASTSLSPKSVIKVLFINQPVEYLRPMSQTCFGILHLARQYGSFSQFRSNEIFAIFAIFKMMIPLHGFCTTSRF